ncbi:reduced coenzyme F420:NADP oxidoreductase [Geodermatophilus africanus]|uniref:Reduced coenzyme F420:NADP oxidoreductase n=1 Tax=Geodermatophilus africanus TaxID=1137993 RepID=A0A1H3PLK2_9ACTN|nr:NADPH-dependent F420 reductase [Geodermatophilus africanus]SDZ01868.1 reduced coenzyme F420:NADP oxidoreductase [Geodermatophilus africanus]
MTTQLHRTESDPIKPLTDVTGLLVGVVGGTGPQGRGLAVRLAGAGQRVLLGSRDAERAAAVAKEVAERAAGVAAEGIDVSVGGCSNLEAAGEADVVIIAVPFAAHADTLAEVAGALAGKVVIDCAVPMAFDKQGAYALDVPEGSVAQQAAALLPDSVVVGAFHHLSAVLLEDLAHSLEGDVLVVGDDRAATDTVQALAGRLPGMRGVYAGRLRNARQVEALTINLVSINRRYKVHAGVRITDV